MISVRRARVLPLEELFIPPNPASFRFRLSTDTLAFGYDLPAAGRSRDFHPLECALAGRTKKKGLPSQEQSLLCDIPPSQDLPARIGEDVVGEGEDLLHPVRERRLVREDRIKRERVVPIQCALAWRTMKHPQRLLKTLGMY